MICHGTKRAKGCLSRDKILQVMFNLGQCAKQNWRILHGLAELAKAITRIKLKMELKLARTPFSEAEHQISL
jgi:putative transposase